MALSDSANEHSEDTFRSKILKLLIYLYLLLSRASHESAYVVIFREFSFANSFAFHLFFNKSASHTIKIFYMGVDGGKCYNLHKDNRIYCIKKK